MDTIEQLVETAKIAEQAERYEDMRQVQVYKSCTNEIIILLYMCIMNNTDMVTTHYYIPI